MHCSVVKFGTSLSSYVPPLKRLSSVSLLDFRLYIVLIPLQIPGFGLYKLFNLVRPLLGMFLPSLFGPKAPRDANGTANANATTGEPEEKGESRRQAKLRARMEKGDKRVQQSQVKRQA